MCGLPLSLFFRMLGYLGIVTALLAQEPLSSGAPFINRTRRTCDGSVNIQSLLFPNRATLMQTQIPTPTSYMPGESQIEPAFIRARLVLVVVF